MTNFLSTIWSLFPITVKRYCVKNINNNMLSNIDNISCKYYLPKDVSRDISNNKLFSILNLNIRSIVNKLDSFKILLESLKHSFSIISLTETWLDNENCTDFNLDNFSFVCTNRDNRKGGGVELMYISDDLNFKLRPDLNIHINNI